LGGGGLSREAVRNFNKHTTAGDRGGLGDVRWGDLAKGARNPLKTSFPLSRGIEDT